MATNRKSNKPAGIQGRDDDFGVFAEQYFNKRKSGGGSATKSTGVKKPTTKK